MINFLAVMDSGKSVQKILYKPYSLPYYHIKTGGLIVMLVLTIYADGIVGLQSNAMTTNILADYYYHTDQKLEAGILYENAWSRYRNNPKAKHATAQLLFQQNQPTLAKQHLEESFAEAPQVDNILLIADRLHLENKIFESVYYLERGLNVFPGNPYLLNNLSLLYTKINRSEDAYNLLTSYSGDNSTVKSNLTALKIKLGQPDEVEDPEKGIVSEINQIANANALGNQPDEALLESLENRLPNETSPMLIQAGYRNLWSLKGQYNPEEDLALLDSLARQPEMTDYIMSLQETAVIRSLAAGRVTEVVKNLNGLAFRNPGDAGYYLQLSGAVLAQNLDFKKATLELIAAQEKGFQAFQTQHWSIFGLGGRPDIAQQIRLGYNLDLPAYVQEEGREIPKYLELIGSWHESMPQDLLAEWNDFPDHDLKTDLAIRLIMYKSHGLKADQLQELETYLESKIGPQEALSPYLTDPDLKNKESVQSLLDWLGLGDELTGNPYLTPLILSAVEINQDPLVRYELLNTATEFNKDPILWIKKAAAAREIGLDNYADESLVLMEEWVSPENLERLKSGNY